MIASHEDYYTNTPASGLNPLLRYRPAHPGRTPVVSLVTAVFNPGRVFHQAANSVFRQSLQQWEWIIADDGSTDPDSLSLLEDYRRADPRIRVLRSDGRVGCVRNGAVAAARALFIAFVDSDDLLEPTALEKLRWFLEGRPEMAFTRGYTAGFEGQSYRRTEGLYRDGHFLEISHSPLTAMVRRQVYIDAGGMSEGIRRGLEDWEFWLRCADRGFRGEVLPEVLDRYRRRTDHEDRWTSWDDAGRMRSLLTELKELYPSVFTSGEARPGHAGPHASPHLGYGEQTGVPFENALVRGPNVKRLLLIVPQFGIGGADKFNLDLVRTLQGSHGYEVTVVATLPGEHPWLHCFERLTPDVFTLNTFLRPADYHRFLEYLIGSRSCDAVLISHSELGYQLLPLLRMRCPGPVFADFIHMEDEEWKAGGYPRYSLDYAPFLDLTIASSAHLKKWMAGNGGNPERISVCTTNIDPAVWDRARYNPTEIRKKFGIASGTPVIAFAGRLCDQKRPDVLAHVVRDLSRRGVRFVCLAAGDGPYRGFLENFAAANNLAELKILGAKRNEEIREILAIADLYFMPSRKEGIALAIYEAMSMGAVPVSADVGGQSELVTPECGVLVKPGPEEIPAYTRALLDLLGDPVKRKAMAERARTRICDAFSLKAMGAQMASLLAGPAEGQPFEVNSAFKSWRGGRASGFTGQERYEFLAAELHRQGAMAISPEANEDYVAMLSLAGRAFRGNLLVLPRLLRSSGIGLPGALRTLIFILSPRHPVRQARNLALCARTLSNPVCRGRLLETFDAEFYRNRYPDVGRSKVIPLLHYALVGHMENRRPSRQFDPDAVYRLNPELQRRGINPLLAMILAGQTAV